MLTDKEGQPNVQLQCTNNINLTEAKESALETSWQIRRRKRLNSVFGPYLSQLLQDAAHLGDVTWVRCKFDMLFVLL